jgi:hypothetical protein
MPDVPQLSMVRANLDGDWLGPVVQPGAHP